MAKVLLAIYDRLPRSFRAVATKSFTRFRECREIVAARFLRRYPPTGGLPRIVYMSGMHRSGTSLLKTYFSGYPGLAYSRLDPSGFFKSWNRLDGIDGILIDKSNHYVDIPHIIHPACGGQAAFCIVVRDPRDNLVSLWEWDESLDIPRDEDFWDGYWTKQYGRFVDYAAANAGNDFRAFMIRYEDLVRWPVAAKEEFLRWLDLPLTAPIDTGYKADSGDRGVEPKARSRSKVEAHSVGRWKETADPELARLMPTWKRHPRTVALMARFGYDESGAVDRPIDLPGIAVFQPRVPA